MFTMCLLIITSCVSMQLFCFIGSSSDYKKFDTFDQVIKRKHKLAQYDRLKLKIFISEIHLILKILKYLILYHKFYKNKYSICKAFMTQFALITSEGWTETMYETMRAAGEEKTFYFYTYFIPIYFIFSHMFCSLVKII
jgi:hypothetical protein